MGMLANYIINREKGHAPLSIGTSLALESLGGFGEFESDTPPISRYNELWVNLRTIFRNCFNAVERTVHADMQGRDLIDAFVEDIQVLASTIDLKSSGRLTPVFYVQSYKTFMKTFPNAKWKEINTAKQQLEFDVEQKVIALFLKEHKEALNMDVREYDTKITDKGDQVVMLTHYPSDLLYRSSFSQLTLLESHSGALKTKPEWYTKLTSGKKYNRIPFNRMTLQVFGDGNVLFSSMSIKIKNRLLSLAEEHNWTPVTTDEKVRYSINQLYDPRERQFFLGLLNK